MRLETIDVPMNAMTPEQKERLIEKVTAVVLEVQGENLRPVTWVQANEFKGGDWAIGGQRLSAYDVLQTVKADRV